MKLRNSIYSYSILGLSLFSKANTHLTSSHNINYKTLNCHVSRFPTFNNRWPKFIFYKYSNRWNNDINLNIYYNTLNIAKNCYDNNDFDEGRELIKSLVLQLESIKHSGHCSDKLNDLLFKAYSCQGLYFTLGEIEEVKLAFEGYIKALQIKPNIKLEDKLEELSGMYGVDELYIYNILSALKK